ncbi:MAG TPA: hypothetical protein VMU94_02190 [Streptosporangiaceae bacterium]|nr:hypothetical protein [Streptosporangiaceae bacterium]
MWERGEVRPGRHYRRGLAEFTGLTEASLGFGPALPLAGDVHAPVEEDGDTNRREMITSMMAAGVALSGFPLAPRTEVPDRVGPRHVAELRRLTEVYRTGVYQHGADHELQRGITRLLGRATTLIGQVSAPQLRRDLLDATADSAGLAAYACRDLGQHEWAQRHYMLAMQAAHAAGDHALAGHLVVRMAGHNIELAQPEEVLAYLEVAECSRVVAVELGVVRRGDVERILTSSPSSQVVDLHPARPCVYLDQWVWIRLAKAAKGQPREADPYAGARGGSGCRSGRRGVPAVGNPSHRDEQESKPAAAA